MKQKIKKFIPVLELIKNLSEQDRHMYLKSAKTNIIKIIAEILYNVNIGTLPISNELLDKLKPFKKPIKNITKKKLSLKARKRILTKANFYSNVVSPLIPVLIEVTK